MEKKRRVSSNSFASRRRAVRRSVPEIFNISSSPHFRKIRVQIQSAFCQFRTITVFRVLFDTIIPVCFRTFHLWNVFIFSRWKWQTGGTGTVPIVSAHFRSLFRLRATGGQLQKSIVSAVKSRKIGTKLTLMLSKLALLVTSYSSSSAAHNTGTTGGLTEIAGLDINNLYSSTPHSRQTKTDRQTKYNLQIQLIQS